MGRDRAVANEIAAQDGAIPVTDTRAGWFPLNFHDARFRPDFRHRQRPARVTAQGPAFDEALLFYPPCLSGSPAILKAFSYWT